MRPPCMCIAFIAAASLFAQQGNSFDEALIFPPANELLLAAQHGYNAGKESRMDFVYQPPWRDPIIHPCRTITREARVAGPLLLAAMEGQTAKKHSKGMPSSDEILRSSGTLLFEIVFFARKPDEEATAVLAVGSRTFEPLETYVNKVETVPCSSGFYGTQLSAIQVRESFTFGFAAGQVSPDWNGTVKLRVRRNEIVEPLDLNLLPVLADQAKRARRDFH